MYSVFLVEDEVVVREGIRNSIPWAETPYVLVGEAPDGEMALSILKDVKPDILITDIKMPFMDGLALSRIVKKTQPWVKIIILSGHDEFSYAKEAISIGVEDYLLKPCSASDMLAVLQKVAARIEAEKQEKSNTERLRQRIIGGTEILRQRWLCDLVSGSLSFEVAFEQAREWDLDLVSRHYAIAIVELNAEGGAGKSLERSREIIENLANASGEIIPFSFGVETLAFIIKGASLEMVDESAYSLAQGIKFEVERNTPVRVAVGIGSTVSRLAELPQSFSDAKTAVKYLSTTGKFKIIGINDIRAGLADGSAYPGSDPIADRLRYTVRSDVECLVDQWSTLLGDNGSGNGITGYYLLYDIVFAASTVGQELGLVPADIFPDGIDQERISLIAQSEKSFRDEVRRILFVLIDKREMRNGSGRENLIQRAKRYIDAHYFDPDISLHVVASQVNVSPNHFSTVFSQEAGESFIEYLTCVRLSRAKQLLVSTSMKSVDIAHEVGFSDPHYFSFLFKKHEGISPREFRSDKNEAEL